MRITNTPSVTINEPTRQFQTPNIVNGTTALVTGFASKGEVYNPVTITTIIEFLNYFGKPETEIEFYFYTSIESIINNGGVALCIRLPYDNTMEENYKYYEYTVDESAGTTSVRASSVGPIGSDAGCQFGPFWQKYTNPYNSPATIYCETSGYLDDTHVIIHEADFADLSAASFTPNLTARYYGYTPPKSPIQPVRPVQIRSDSCETDQRDPYRNQVPAHKTLFRQIEYTVNPDVAGEYYGYWTGDQIIVQPGDSIYTNVWNTQGPLAVIEPVITWEASGAFIDNWVEDVDNESYDNIVTSVATSYPSYMLVNEHKAVKTGRTYDEGLFAIAVTVDDALSLQYNLIEDYVFNIVGKGELNESEFSKPLSGTFKDDSTSLDFVNLYPDIESVELSGASYIAPEYENVVTLIVAETKRNSNDSGKLDINILEAHTGSVSKTDIIEGGPNHKQSYYIGDIINRDSNYVKFVESGNTDLTIDIFTNDLIPPSIQLLSFDETDTTKTININELFNNINTALSKVDNKNEYNVDILVDAGISSIASTVDSDNNYDDTITTINTNNNNVTNWIAVLNSYREFCEGRKDCVAIVDTPRFIELTGDMPKIRKTNPTSTFTNSCLPILKKLTTGRSSSYISAYITWLKTLNTFNNKKTWIPPSTKAIGPYVKNDRVNGFYLPPANWSVATLDNITELSYHLNKKEMDLIYLNGYNYIIQNKNNGITIEGDKTFFRGNTVFSSMRNRRIMNKLNTYVNDISLRFMMEGNNELNRSRLTAKIDSIFKLLKDREVIYDYMVKCDNENNPPVVIDNNELRVSVGIKFTSNVEFILADFILTATNTDFKTVLKLY